MCYLKRSSVSLSEIDKLAENTLLFFKMGNENLTLDELKDEWRNFLISQKYIALETPVAFRNKDLHLKPYPISEETYLQTLNVSPIIVSTVEMTERMSWINSQPIHEQRSKEWFEIRNTLISASSAHNIFKSAASRKTFKEQKAFPSEFTSGGGAACQHGIRFEPVATELYSVRNKVIVGEYGCIRHREIDCVGASPDGIVTSEGDLFGTMLEIKCPYSREITGYPPIYYWIQVQIQLEVCNLEACDFLECKFVEYKNISDFINRSSDMESGIIIEYMNNNEKKYLYSGLRKTNDEYTKWYNDTLDEILPDASNIISKITYWTIEKYVCTKIIRSREWFKSIVPEFLSFWEEVQECKKGEIPESLVKKKKKTSMGASYAFSDDS
tara:strand:+ start:13323 stop:14474 length:1152 start_codon:yes stop_codon:yes gene_type:complete